MKTSCPATSVLSSLVLSSALAWSVPASAQVSNTYTLPPPPGYPAPGAPPKQTSTRASRQSAAAVQPPVTHTQYPPTYPPPAGYTYPPPPGYGINQHPPTSKSSATKGKSSSKTPAAKPAGPPPPPKVYGPTGDLTNQVEKLRDSDRVQNLRIGALERDVSSIKRNGKSGSRYDGGSDLAAYTTYISRPGDTLWSIATKHRVSVGEIQQLNRMTGEDVSVGQTLLIPSPHRTPETTTASYTPPTPGGAMLSSPPPATTTTTVVTAPLYYTVKKGDSLKGIALKHKTTAVALASANKIKDVNKITVGQRIKIPGRTTKVTVAAKTKAPRSSPSSDTVPLPGFGTSGAPPPPAAGLAAPPPPATGLSPMPLSPAPAAPAPKAPDLSDSHRGILAYRVDRTDTIESIATQFTTTPDHIREMNRLAPGSMLKPGDEIMVPAMGAVSLKN